jgi:hypothetical protein
MGIPSFLYNGLLIPGAPEFAKALGMTTDLPNGAMGMIYLYLGTSVGDIGCGLTSKWIGSRKYAIFIYHLIVAASAASCFLFPPKTSFDFYTRCVGIGVGLGYWGNLVTNAAEQFPTKVRGTVAIAVPNLVRVLLLPISTSFLALKSNVGFFNAAIIVGIVCSALGIISTLSLPDGIRANLSDEKT